MKEGKRESQALFFSRLKQPLLWKGDDCYGKQNMA